MQATTTVSALASRAALGCLWALAFGLWVRGAKRALAVNRQLSTVNLLMPSRAALGGLWALGFGLWVRSAKRALAVNRQLSTVNLLVLVLMSACARHEPEYVWTLPPGFPQPVVPADNPMTEAKVALGRKLFYDTRLSANQTQACASCHQQAYAFSDPRTRSIGSTGEVHHRNSMSLANVGYNATFTWAHSGISSIEQHIAIPLFGDAPVEMNAAGHEQEILARLAADPAYRDAFKAAFGRRAPIDFDHVAKALASFVRSLTSFDSPFDRYAYHADDSALTQAQIRGMNLFMSERLECSHCHNGFNFSQFVTHESSAIDVRAFHNTGLYLLEDPLARDFDFGLQRVTHSDADRYKFKAPTLRNIARTAPYMHDGSIATLEDVIDFYAAGGREVTEGPFRGDGRRNPTKSAFVKGFELSPQETADLLSFLHSLTDERFLNDPKNGG